MRMFQSLYVLLRVSVVLFNTVSSIDNALYVESVLKLCLLNAGSI